MGYGIEEWDMGSRNGIYGIEEWDMGLRNGALGLL